MGTLIVVLVSPVREDHAGLAERIYQLAVQALLPEAAVEAFRVSVLPRAAGIYIQRLYMVLREPLLDSPGDELRTVVRANILWRPMLAYRVAQSRQDIRRLDGAVRVDAAAFPRVLVDQAEGAKPAAALRMVRDEVPGPYVVAALGLLRQSGRQPLAPDASPGRRNLKAFLPANPLDELLVGDEAGGSRLGRDLPVSKRRVRSRRLRSGEPGPDEASDGSAESNG